MLKKIITFIFILFSSQASLLAMQQPNYQGYDQSTGQRTAAYEPQQRQANNPQAVTYQQPVPEKKE